MILLWPKMGIHAHDYNCVIGGVQDINAALRDVPRDHAEGAFLL
jgi:hypothetical protein